MPPLLNLRLQQALADRLRFYNELGIYDFYRQAMPAQVLSQERTPSIPSPKVLTVLPASIPEMPQPSRSTDSIANSSEVLRAIREDIGDCTRCRLSQGRKKIVFGVGDPNADLMFIGEAPGADEDERGEPFVGRAGQLLTNMIKAMGINREQIYIANIIKCRPPGNRPPERDECATCSPFLMRQIEAVQPRVVVALGAVAAKTLLAVNAPMSELRGRWFDFRGRKLAVTYHPAFLLRDPRQKKETWKDLQMVMQHLGLPMPAKTPE